MNMLRVLQGTTLVMACIGLSGCEREATTTKPSDAATVAAATRDVYVTFHPLEYFAKTIGGGVVTVVNPCPGEADPATWMPSDRIIAEYQQAALIVANGADFEEWLAKVTLPEDRLVVTTAPLKGELIHLEHAMTHSHGPGGEHTHEGLDGHTWLDPINAKAQARVIRDALDKTFPAEAEAFQAGFQKLAKDLEALDSRLRGVSEKLGDRVLFANHPAYNYLGQRYGWKLKNFHLEPDELPAEETIDEIKAYVADHPRVAGIMLWESEPDEDVARRLKETAGLTAVVFAPGETLDPDQRAAGATYLSIMNANLDRLEDLLRS